MKKYFHICSMLILKLKNMLGKPKFKIGDEVCFEWKGATKNGIL